MLQAAAEISSMGMEFIGVIKQAHSLFPKDYLQNKLAPLPAGSRLVMTGKHNDQDLLAIGYKYNRKKVLFFVCTPGAGSIEDGTPYTQRWADDNGNIMTRLIPRPAVLSKYFEVSPRVDNHNQARQHELALEELWQTQDCWFRLHTTLHGILVTDCWKLVKYHVPNKHRLKDVTINDFADELARALILNNLSDQPSTRASSRKSGPRPLPDPKPTAFHTIQLLARSGAKTKQLRCRWCSIFSDDITNYTSFKCLECGVALCVRNNREASRDCFRAHCHASARDLELLRANAKTSVLRKRARE